MSAPSRLPSLDGMTVTRIVVDDSLTLGCRNHRNLSAEIRVDGSFTYSTAGKRYHGCMEEDPTDAAPLLALLFTRIRTGLVTGDAALELSFSNDSKLSAWAEDHFVSWEIRDSSGFHAICLGDRNVLIRNAVHV